MWIEINKYGQKLKVVGKKLEMRTKIDKDGQKFMERRQIY